MKGCRSLILFLTILIVAFLPSCSTTSFKEESKDLTIHFFSTSATSWGDCTYIEFPNGESMLIDCGTKKAASEILADFREKGITHIDYLVISHYHSDHVGGLQEILPVISFGDVYTTGYYPTDFSWVDLNLRQIQNLPIHYVKAGDSFDIGEVHFDVLWPTAEMVSERPQVTSKAVTGPGSTIDMNCHSMVLRMTFRNNSALFTGDAYIEAQKEILELYRDNLSVLDCDVLKIMHHGYSNANGNEDFIIAVSPKYAFSMGTATMEMLHYLYYYKAGAEVFMSWYNGNSYVTMDGDSISVVSEKEGVNPGYAKYVESWERLQETKNN